MLGAESLGLLAHPSVFTQRGIDFNERLKHEMLQLEDIAIGHGPIAAAGRKVTAEITVRYSAATPKILPPQVALAGILY